MISLISSPGYSPIWESIKHEMAAESEAGSGRVLSREEIEVLNAQGAFTDPRHIPKDHSMTRVSVPSGRRYRVI